MCLFGFFNLHQFPSRAKKSLFPVPVNNQSKIYEAVHSFLGRVSLMALIISVLFFSYSFKAIWLKIITLPTPSYNPHQWLFAEKLTQYPRVNGWKIRYLINSINYLGVPFSTQSTLPIKSVCLALSPFLSLFNT